MDRGACAWVLMTVLMAPATSASPSPGVTDAEILIGSCAALEGPAKFLGTQTVLGAMAYLKDVNERGGIHGRKLRLVSYDDGYEPERAVECFNRLRKDDIFAAAFFVGTPTAAKYVPLVEAEKLPLVGLFTGAPFLYEPVKRYVINVRASYDDESQHLVDNLWSELGFRKVGVIYQDDAFGAAVLGGVKKALARHDAVPSAEGSFPRNTLEVQRAIDQVRGTGPEAVILVGPYAPVAEIVKRSHGAGWKPLYLTVSFVGTEAFIDAAGADAEGTVITQVVPPYKSIELPGVVRYLDALKKYFPGNKPSFASLEGFVDAMVLGEGLSRAGRDLTREKLVDAIESIAGLEIGLGPNLKLAYGPRDHKGFDNVYSSVVRQGYAVTLTNWKGLATASKR
jgi:branched-chain amino acid transport system substrate-binding protein